MVPDDLFAGGAKVGAWMRNSYALRAGFANGVATLTHDWSQTPLGSVATWSPSLKTALSILLNSCCPMFLVWGRDRILLYNDAYYSILEQRQHPVSLGESKDWWDETWYGIRSDAEQVFATGQSLRRENERLPMEDGSSQEHSYTWSYSAIWDETGVGGVFATGCRVIAEAVTNAPTSEETKQQLQRTNQTLKTLIEASPLPLIAIEPDMTVQLWNPAATRLFGWSEAEVLGKPIPIVPEEKLEECRQVREVLTKGETFFGIETYRCKRDGSNVIVNISAAPLYDESGTVNTIILILQDVTQQKQAEATLRESEARFQAFMSHSPASAWIADREGRLLYLSPTYFRMFQLPQQDAVGKRIHDIYTEEFAQQFIENNRRVFETQQVIETIETAPRPDGSIGDFLVYKFPIIRESEETLLGGVAIDITERKRDEETIRSLLSISEKLNSTLEVDTLLDLLVEEAIKLVNAESGCSGLYTSEGMVCHKYFQQGEPLPLEYFWHPGHGLPGWLILHPVPYLTNDALTDTQIVHELCVQFGVRSALCTPILNAQEEILGFLEMHNKKDGSGFTQSDREKLVAVSQIAAIAIQNALSYRNLQQTEETLRQSEERFQLVAQATNDSMWDFNPLTNELWWSERVKPLFGYQPDNLDPGLEAWINLIHPDDKAWVQASFEAYLNSGESVWTEEYRFRRADGSYAYIFDRACIVRDETGRCVRVVGAMTDITARKQAEQEREQLLARERVARIETSNAKEQIVSILESITDGFMAFDKEWRFTYLNHQGVRTLGRSHDELLGKNLWDEFPELAETSFGQLYQRAMAEGIALELEDYYPPFDAYFAVRAYPSASGLALYFRNINARKQTEEALKRRQEELRLITNAVPALIAYVGKDQYYRFSNQTYETWFGQPVAQVIGKHVREVLGESAYEAVRSYLEQALSGHRVSFESQIPYRDGGTRYISAEYIPHINSQGDVEGFISLVSDISNRKQAENALRQSEERFQLIAQATNDLMWDFNVLTDRMWWSERVQQLFGYRPEDLGLNMDGWAERVHPDDLERTHSSYEACLCGEASVWTDEYRFRRADGSYAYILDRAYIIRDTAGSPVRIVGAMTDLSDRKRAEEALRQSEERYRYLAESIPQLVWTANAEGVLLDVNQRWLDFTGLTLAQAQILGWQAIVHPDDVLVLSQRWAAAQQNGTYYQASGRMRRVDGIYRWHLHQAVPLKNELGQVIKWFGTATDIEDQKQLEQQRDRILQQEQAAREEAERANRIKDEFLAVLSHELRTPLNPILGWANLLQTRKFDPASTKRALETIERNAKLQTQLIDDLLDVSRILRGKMVLNVYPVDLVTVIDAALETVRLSAEAKSIQIEKVFAPDVGLVRGDSGRLQQVVWNLLSNAVKFTPSSGRIEIRLERVGTDAQIQVKDTGIGITPEFLPYVFEYFRQEDGTTTRKFGGLGLGLAIARYLTELHGGTVKAESPGERLGATFTVRFPLLKNEGGKINGEEGANSSPIQSSSSLPLAGLRILAVDDEADMRELMLVILEESGASVKIAASAAEVLEAFELFKPDVLISDIGMPQMDGYMLMRQVRMLPPEQGGRIPAIALTAYAGEYDQKQAKAAGFQQHIPKPVEPETLVQAIASLLGS